MLLVSIMFPIHTFLIVHYMLRRDGFGFWRQIPMWAKGLWWLYKPGGVFSAVLGHYLQYYKPGFHPWQEGQLQSYERWLDTFNRTGDPIAAGNAVFSASA